MARKPYTLIHTALAGEAAPLCRHFGLRQIAVSPFRMHRTARLLLVESGPAREASRKALEYVFGRYSIRRAINFGIAGCNDKTVEIGSLFAVQGGPPGLKRLPLISFDSPANELNAAKASLVDMEADEFLKIVGNYLEMKEIHILKVVSDHLDDCIPSKAFLDQIIIRSLRMWDELADDQPAKIDRAMQLPPADILSKEDRESLKKCGVFHRLSFQELKNLADMAADFAAWDSRSLAERLKQKFPSGKALCNTIKKGWEEEKNSEKNYEGFTGRPGNPALRQIVEIDRPSPGFGRCPVASPKTRCCNLMTLDAVEGCAFDCSYCSIRYFYNSGTVGINRDIINKLKEIKLDPQKRYHIGTGQSSDSLMWGNRNGILEGLLQFAAENPNVILEFKTKSDNISYLMQQKIPANIICSWSLSPQIIIDNEEHHSASLNRRLESARSIADKGNLVGFHFHPMIIYQNWQADYAEIIHRIGNEFSAREVCMISFGTLTFSKAVIKKMRNSGMKTRILQMPLEEANGKLSYPKTIRKEMFRFAYDSFHPWHNSVFFYLCMEDESLWPLVFNREYRSNEKFEEDMIRSYFQKIDRISNTPAKQE